MGCETYAVAPGTLLPPAPEVLGCDHVTSDLDSVLPELDVVYMLRVQQERLEGAPFPTIREYHNGRPPATLRHPGAGLRRYLRAYGYPVSAAWRCR